MKQCFAPSGEICAIRILWACFPLGLFATLWCLGMLSGESGILLTLLILLTSMGVMKNLALWLETIAIEDDRIIVYKGRHRSKQVYLRSLIEKPRAYNQIVRAVFLNRSFCFKYREAGEVTIDLSLYDEEVRERLVESLSVFLPNLEVIDTI